MGILVGEYFMKIAIQNKITIPQQFVKECETDVFIVKKDDPMGCLVVYPMETWKEELAILRAKLKEDITSQEMQNYFRYFMKNTHKTKLIKHSSRITIPPAFLDLFNQEKDVVLIGLDHKFEIWPKSSYEEIENHYKKMNEQFAEIIGSKH